MRIITSSALACALVGQLSAQSFSDDFEAYTAGALLGNQSMIWTTWSGNGGGADDVPVVDDTAASGNNSIYFEASSSAGGPDDVVLPFGSVIDAGEFNFEMNMLLDANSGAYFNFQAQTTVGQEWTLECNITEAGDFSIGNTGGSLLTGNFNPGGWNNLKFEIDLDLNSWNFLVNDVSQGMFSNTVNQLASVNIFAYNGNGNGTAKFWIDDVAYEHITTTLPDLNAAVSAVTAMSGLTGSTKPPTVTVKNLGVNAITSFDLAVTYNGNTINESITGVNLASYDESDIELSSTVTLASGTNNLVATVSNVNGAGADDDPTDDSKTIVVSPVDPGLNKRVVVEEATGTWCGWCPRGAVWMERMQLTYPEHFIGIAVHNGDPMTNADYDAAIGDLIGGYPSSLVDRTPEVDPSQMEPEFLDQVVLDAAASLCHSAKYIESSGELEVTLVTTLAAAIENDWTVAVAITEDNVTGTASNYGQTNYYAGGGSGQLSGAGHDWHTSPSVVPASQMEYDHVARLIAPSFEGLSNAFPDGGSANELHSFVFTLALDAAWDTNEMHVVTMLINGDGVIDNGHQTTLEEALAADCSVTGVANVTFESPKLSAYPNPAEDSFTAAVVASTSSVTKLELWNAMGQLVASQSLPAARGLQSVDFSTEHLATGVYHLCASNDQLSTTLSVMVR